MPRALWKGAISSGLVHIPVELFAAVEEHDLNLTMLDRRDFSPIGFKRYNKANGEEVSWDDIVKGYEYADGEYVVLSDEDLKRANVKASQTIDIVAFVEAADVPLTYYVQPYYLAPSKGGAKVYALLRDTLRKAGKIGIANVVIRTRQHLAALLCIDDAIVLNTLRYPDEIRAPQELIPAQSEAAGAITGKELQMALSLVEGMSEAWQPEQYRDTFRDDVLALVERKVLAQQTKTITLPGPEKQQALAGNVVDLVALLKQSLGQSSAKGGRSKPAPGTAQASSARKRPTERAPKSETGAAAAKRRAP